MKRFLGAVIIGAVTIHAFGAAVVKLFREPGKVAFAVEKGYGIQRDGKHELTFTSADGKELKKVTNLSGTVASEDKKYFSKLNAVQLPEAKGKMRVTGRIFYCSFEQKFCSVQKIDEQL